MLRDKAKLTLSLISGIIQLCNLQPKFDFRPLSMPMQIYVIWVSGANTMVIIQIWKAVVCKHSFFQPD